MKHCDNSFTGPIKRPVRKSLQALSATGRFQFDFYSRDYWAWKKEHFEQFESIAGFSQEDYVKWLAQHKLYDNAFNRHRFLNYLRERDEASET